MGRNDQVGVSERAHSHQPSRHAQYSLLQGRRPKPSGLESSDRRQPAPRASRSMSRMWSRPGLARDLGPLAITHCRDARSVPQFWSRSSITSRAPISDDWSTGIALHRGCPSIKKLPRCRTVKMPDPCSDKSGRLEVHRVHRNRRISVFPPIRVVGDAPTFLASIIGANLPVP